jgi:hypothetical protein
MRLGMDLVDKYKLGKPEGYNKSISGDDIIQMENAVHRIPKYSYDPNEKLAADGVDLNRHQRSIVVAHALSRLAVQIGDESIANDAADTLTMSFRSSAYENWVTSDSELVGLFDSYRNGGSPQKKTALGKLIHIFLTVTQASATQLFNRLSMTKKGDLVSDRFNSVFFGAIRTDMLNALQIQR